MSVSEANKKRVSLLDEYVDLPFLPRVRLYPSSEGLDFIERKIEEHYGTGEAAKAKVRSAYDCGKESLRILLKLRCFFNFFPYDKETGETKMPTIQEICFMPLDKIVESKKDAEQATLEVITDQDILKEFQICLISNYYQLYKDLKPDGVVLIHPDSLYEYAKAKMGAVF